MIDRVEPVSVIYLISVDLWYRFSLLWLSWHIPSYHHDHHADHIIYLKHRWKTTNTGSTIDYQLHHKSQKKSVQNLNLNHNMLGWCFRISGLVCTWGGRFYIMPPSHICQNSHRSQEDAHHFKSDAASHLPQHSTIKIIINKTINLVTSPVLASFTGLVPCIWAEMQSIASQKFAEVDFN